MCPNLQDTTDQPRVEITDTGITKYLLLETSSARVKKHKNGAITISDFQVLKDVGSSIPTPDMKGKETKQSTIRSVWRELWRFAAVVVVAIGVNMGWVI